MAIKISSFERLSKRLGEIDKERREILKQLKATPELGVKFLSDMLKSFINTNSTKWFLREGEKSGISYWRLQSFKITENKPAVTARTKALLVNVDLEWEVYAADGTKIIKSEVIKMSAFNDVEGQILNGRRQASASDVKRVLKLALTEKKKKLEEDLKSLKEELAKL